MCFLRKDKEQELEAEKEEIADEWYALYR